jgi:acetyl-CoA carboxylase carboxyl transferase subunit beta
MTTPVAECPHDGERIDRGGLDEHFLVCPRCGYHHRLSARERVRTLTDRGSFDEFDHPGGLTDPLGFVDSKPYPDRLTAARRQSGEREAVLVGTATVGGRPVVLAVMDFGFIGGSMGSAVGRAIARAVGVAVERRVPLVTVAASGGARMQEGCFSLMQMATTSTAIARLGEAGVPYLSILTDPTYGGVTASFASLGDVLIAEPGARIGFAGKDIVASTTRRELPTDFQTAEYQLNSGMIDLVVPRRHLRDRLGELLAYYAAANTAASLPHTTGPRREPNPVSDAWQVVTASRNPKRPTTQDYIDRVFDSFHPLHGDRVFGDDPAVVGGLARLGGVACVVVGTQRGHTARETHERNYGMPHPEGYRKSLRLMRHAAKFGMPVVTFVDTLGAHPGEEAERRGQAQAIAQNLYEMSGLPVPIVAAITGQGGSGGALALAMADRVLMLENAYYSVITPESCSLILFKNVSAADRMARNLKLTATDLERFGVVDEVVAEPDGGAHTDFDRTAAALRHAIVRHLRDLMELAPARLVEERYERYARFGDATCDEPELVPAAG